METASPEEQALLPKRFDLLKARKEARDTVIHTSDTVRDFYDEEEEMEFLMLAKTQRLLSGARDVVGGVIAVGMVKEERMECLERIGEIERLI